MAIRIQGVTIINDETSFIHLAGTSAVRVPAGPTGSRPTGGAGDFRFNTTDNTFEGHDGTQWGTIGGSDEVARTLAALAL